VTVTVQEHYAGRTRTFEGPEDEVAGDLYVAYPILSRVGRHAGVAAMVKLLDKLQAYSASASEDSGPDIILKHDALRDQLGVDPGFAALLRVAETLAGRPAQPTRRGEDAEASALRAVGLEPTEENRRALAALYSIRTQRLPLAKAEKPEVSFGQDVDVKEVQAVFPDGEAFAEDVRLASKTPGRIRSVTLGEGRHSQGTMVAKRAKGGWLLLKPGSGAQGPQAGEADVQLSQSRREAAFYAAVCAMGVPDDPEENPFVECRLLSVDGREYAAMPLLSGAWTNCNRLAETDPVLPRRVCATYLPQGDLHLWAAVDYVLGNPDRNAGNVMVRGGDITLIDAGSALAGEHFSPATDPQSFVPFYLRVMAPGDFERATPEEKLRALPRLHPDPAQRLALRLQAVKPEDLAAALERHGADPAACVRRLAEVVAMLRHSPADLAVNTAWTLG